MKTTLFSALAVFSLAVPSIALACEGHDKTAAKPSVKKVTVAELETLKKDAKPTVLDANGTETRAKMGIIPGAVLLSSSSQYDTAKELPADKAAKLVFYCASTRCTASHSAAERALSNGYTDVSILPEGIQGWKKAGKATAVPQS